MGLCYCGGMGGYAMPPKFLNDFCVFFGIVFGSYFYVDFCIIVIVFVLHCMVAEERVRASH